VFTGIIEKIGKLIRKIIQNGILEMTFQVDNEMWDDLVNGESIAVNGVCLTIISFSKTTFTVNVSNQTIRSTNFSSLIISDQVNLERSLRADSRIGGHYVLGHIDATGKISEIRNNFGAIILKIEFPEELYSFIVPKGSIAINGISLTIQELSRRFFVTAIIPFTAMNTNITKLRKGSIINLETDIFAKYLNKVNTNMKSNFSLL
jgi:riboflavin synthase